MAFPSSRRRQPLLLQTDGPWASRFGAGFFHALPPLPGVYFFYDSAAGLLYLGQSGCLRDRIGSYRHVDPDRHPRRILRLIQRTCRIEWRLCASAAEAVALETALLLEHRPPFNRAGVWPAAEAWLGNHQGPEAGPGDWIGPLPGRFRSAFASLTRCLFRVMNPDAGWWDFPSGLLGPDPGPVYAWRSSGGSEEWLSLLRKFLREGCPEFLARLPERLTGPELPDPVREFWTGQLEHLEALERTLVRQRNEAPLLIERNPNQGRYSGPCSEEIRPAQAIDDQVIVGHFGL
jgi:hypothetical protein